MKVLIIKNISHECPGIFGEVLEEYGISSTVIDLSLKQKIPDIKGYDALIVMGGPDSANDNTGKMKEELTLVKEALSLERPYLGVCLGLQVLVKSMGGKVIRHTKPEIGWQDEEGRYTLTLTKEGKKDTLFSGLTFPLQLFHLHGETVELAKDMQLLAVGKQCRDQIIKVGKNAYGIQGHLELTQEMFEDWLKKDPDLRKSDTAGLRKEYARLQKSYETSARTLFKNFLKATELIA